MLCGRLIRLLNPNEVNLLSPIRIKHEGQKSALLLLHGFASSPAVFRELIPKLPHYDAIYCPVLPGHAKDVSAFATCTAKEWIETAEHAYLELASKYQSIDVLGLSLGGLLASHLSAKFPINHLYLLAPALALPWQTKYSLFLSKTLHKLGIKYINNRAGNINRQDYPELTYKKLPIHAIIEILQLIMQQNYPIPRCPTDLFLGKLDKVVDVQQVAHKFANHPNVKIHWLNQSAHVLPLDYELDTIIDVIMQSQIIR